MTSTQKVSEVNGQTAQEPWQAAAVLPTGAPVSALSQAVEQSPASIIITDLAGNITYVNRRFTEITGYSFGEVIGQNPRILKSGETPPGEYQRMWEFITAGGIWRGTFHNRKKDGELYWESASIAPVFNEAGQITHYVAVKEDITQRKQAEAALDRERHFLESLLENSQDCIYFKDRESRILRCSRAVREKSAIGAADIIGKTDFDLFAEEHARPAFEDEQEIVRTGCPMIGKVEREVTKDGHETWALTSKMPLRNKEGEIVGTFGISKDITERQHAEAALARERHLLESLLETSADCIYFKDRESRILRCSKSQTQRYGDGAADLIGKTDFDLFAEEHARPAFEDEQEIMRTGCSMIGRVEREVTKDGRETWALTSKMPLRNEKGEIVGTFGISKDITSIKRAEAELERTHKELVQASRLAGMAEVATSVLHNVGNVLNSINIAATLVGERIGRSRVADVRRLAQLLEEHADDLAAFLTNDAKGRLVPGFLRHLAEKLDSEKAAILEELKSLRSNVEHVKEIIAMQQSYAQVAGVFENIALADLLEDALRMNAGALARHDVKVVRDYSVLPTICTDKHKVLQILINLVRNAKYACEDSGRSDKQVTLRATNGEGRVRITVTDNGVGIPPENLNRIFNHGFTTRKNGHGFGLHSGALAANELGGSLTVHSDGPGLGAAFTLELPCQRPADNQTINTQERQRNSPAPSQGTMHRQSSAEPNK
jgi:PAS domain S-box-containing protein